MRIYLLLILILLSTFTTCKGKAMENTFFTWDDFVENYNKEATQAEELYTRMKENGLKKNSLIIFDFTFSSDDKNNLIELGKYLELHYQYKIGEIEKVEEFWELEGESNRIPLTEDNLVYWVLDMYKRGYDFDVQLDGYGGMTDDKNQEFPDLDSSKEDYYFNEGLKCYENGDLSGSIINWSLTLDINPNDPNSYYSRAIVKNELLDWKAAMEDYNKAIEISPEFVDALVNRGTLKDEHHDYQGAIEDYNKVLSLEGVEIEPKQNAYFNRGNSKFNMKDKKGSCEDWYKALELGADYAKERIDKHCK